MTRTLLAPITSYNSNIWLTDSGYHEYTNIVRCDSFVVADRGSWMNLLIVSRSFDTVSGDMLQIECFFGANGLYASLAYRSP